MKHCLKKIDEDLLELIIFVVILAIGIIGGLYGWSQDKQINKKYGERRYEFVITDKYEDLGSTWHLIGGRATETEYHVAYKYRVINRPDDEDNLVWYIDETSVSGSTYRKYQVGQTLYGNSMILPR